MASPEVQEGRAYWSERAVRSDCWWLGVQLSDFPKFPVLRGVAGRSRDGNWREVPRRKWKARTEELAAITLQCSDAQRLPRAAALSRASDWCWRSWSRGRSARSSGQD
jgi:hypothetical protein